MTQTKSMKKRMTYTMQRALIMLRDAKKGIERREGIEKKVSPTLRCCFDDFRGLGSPTSSGSIKALPRQTDK